MLGGRVMKLISIKCPDCGATLDISQNRKECFCSFCGNKIILDDGSTTVTHIFVDKTREHELVLEEKKLAHEQEQMLNEKRKKKVSFFAICFAFLLALLTFLIVRNDSNVTFNFCIMLVCFLVSLLHKRKSFSLGIAILALCFSTACLLFIILRDDFNSTFTITVAVAIACLFLGKKAE